MGLYVEARIRAGLEDVRPYIQDPARHRRWDLRVLPLRTVDDAGIPADGTERPHRTCTSAPRVRPDATRTSVPRRSSPHPRAPFARGGGYRRLVPDGDGVRLLIGYDYSTRGGALGARADRLLLRPLMVWATAWSVDRLRLWLERGVTPERALLNWCVELAVRAAVITVACTGLGVRSVLLFFGPFAASMAYLWPLLLTTVVCVALYKQPLARTPAARRCLRTTGRARLILRPLENPR
ncbi:hypothetical protein ACFV0T_08840 [Streptomyces sp. NPDC059582]|uniref:hypothetical protein n=1 Tax=Streptomyces sp. NPDC059582 TaxID=3346875 RepID=UPI0036C35845